MWRWDDPHFPGNNKRNAPLVLRCVPFVDAFAPYKRLAKRNPSASGRRVSFWQPEKDSNPHKQSQSLSCYPYTIRLNIHISHASADIIITDTFCLSSTFSQNSKCPTISSHFSLTNKKNSIIVISSKCEDGKKDSAFPLSESRRTVQAGGAALWITDSRAARLKALTQVGCAVWPRYRPRPCWRPVSTARKTGGGSRVVPRNLRP